MYVIETGNRRLENNWRGPEPIPARCYWSAKQQGRESGSPALLLNFGMGRMTAAAAEHRAGLGNAFGSIEEEMHFSDSLLHAPCLLCPAAIAAALPVPNASSHGSTAGRAVSETAELCGAAVLGGEESRAQGCGCRWRLVGGTQQQLCATLWHNPEQCCRIQSKESEIRKRQQDEEVMQSPVQ